MAVNQNHTENRRKAYIPYSESVLNQTNDVDLSFPALPPGSDLFRGTKRGTLLLTSYRVIFVTSHSVNDPMLSFMMPFDLMSNCTLEQPVFAPNYIQGTVQAAPDGGWEGQATFKLSFRKGGAIKYFQLMMKAASAASQGAPLQSITYWFGAPGLFILSGEGNTRSNHLRSCPVVVHGPQPVRYGPPPEGYALPPVEYAPQPVGYAPPPVGYVPPPMGYIPPPAGYVPPPAGYAPPPAGYVPPPAGYAPPPMEYAPPPAGYIPPPAGYAPPPMEYAPPPVGYVPPPAGYAPPPMEYAPPPAGYVPPPEGSEAPPVGYGAPPPGYGAPPPGYEAAPPGYEAPPSGNRAGPHNPVAAHPDGYDASLPSTSFQYHSLPSKN